MTGISTGVFSRVRRFQPLQTNALLSLKPNDLQNEATFNGKLSEKLKETLLEAMLFGVIGNLLRTGTWSENTSGEGLDLGVPLNSSVVYCFVLLGSFNMNALIWRWG